MLDLLFVSLFARSTRTRTIGNGYVQPVYFSNPNAMGRKPLMADSKDVGAALHSVTMVILELAVSTGRLLLKVPAFLRL